MLFSTFLKENNKKTITVWHGGDLSSGFDETINHSKGRWEYGPGLYLTTHYDTAKKYAKGSRKLYQLVIEEGIDLDSDLDASSVLEWIKSNVIKNKQKEVITRISSHIENNKINGQLFINIIINNDAIKNNTTNNLRLFLVANGIDYCLVPNAFGWRELMVVLFNPKKIINSKQIGPKDKIEVFDLPNNFS